MINRNTKLCQQNHGARRAISLILIWLVVCTGCLGSNREKHPQKKIRYSAQWDIQSYSIFLKQNLIETGQKYATEYEPYDFIVDMDYGSTLIQNLIDPAAVSHIKEQLGIKGLEYFEKLSRIFEYVKYNYEFVIDPHGWPTVEETIKTKRGDCNSLSLLLMSLLLSADIHSRAAISNGHMWVYVLYDNEWHILEVDRDPERIKIYKLPGFYQNPVYLIFSDHSEKRKISKSLKPSLQ